MCAEIIIDDVNVKIHNSGLVSVAVDLFHRAGGLVEAVSTGGKGDFTSFAILRQLT